MVAAVLLTAETQAVAAAVEDILVVLVVEVMLPAWAVAAAVVTLVAQALQMALPLLEAVVHRATAVTPLEVQVETVEQQPQAETVEDLLFRWQFLPQWNI
jgi:hypothetical protein